MKKIDEEGLKLCALQADIFAESLETTQCSSRILTTSGFLIFASLMIFDIVLFSLFTFHRKHYANPFLL